MLRLPVFAALFAASVNLGIAQEVENPRAVATDSSAPLTTPEVEQESFRAAINSEGLLTGRFRVLDNASGVPREVESLDILFIQQGRIVRRVDKAIDGVFQVDGLSPGFYSIIASSADGYTSFGVEVTASDADTDDTESRREQLAIDAFLVSQRDFRAVYEVFQRFAMESAGESTASTGARKAPYFVSILDDSPVAGDDSTALRQPTLLLDGDGDGYVSVVSFDPATGKHRAVAGARVAVIRDGVVIQQPTTAADGGFAVSGLSGGIYSLAIATPVGSLATSFEAKKSRSFAGISDSGAKVFPVMFQAGGLTLPLAGGDANGFQAGQGGDGGPQGSGAPVGPGAAPGGGAGGAGGGTGGGAGGGAGGGGGLVGAALGAAIGGGIAAASDDDAPAPVSPAAP